MTKILTLVFVTIFTLNSNASDTRLSKLRAKYNLPAAGMGYIHDAKSQFYIDGVRKFGDPTEAKIDDQFHLGSDTKAMTATLVAWAIEKRLLNWNSTLEEIFGSDIPNMDPQFKAVTVEMLGAHRAGLTGDVGKTNPDLWSKLWNPNLDAKTGRAMVAHDLLSLPPSTKPGTQFVYSNEGYVILGAILDKVTKRSWEDLMQNVIFKTLGMSSCGFGAAGNAAATKPDQPWGHSDGVSPVPVPPGFSADNPPSENSAGRVHCSMQDWAKFVKMHVDGENGKPTKLLKTASFNKLHTSYPGQEYTYGGWIRVERSWAGGPAFNHVGSNTLNMANVWWAPKKDLVLLSVTNSGTDNAATATNEAIGLLLQEVKP